MIELVDNTMQYDTTEEQQTESVLQQLHNKLLLDAILQSTPLAYLAVDNRDDRILYFNNEFCQIWGIEELSDKMEKGQLKSTDIIPFCLKLVAEQSSFTNPRKPLQDEDNRETIEDKILFIDGRLIRRFSGQLRDNFDNYIGRLYIFEDITKREDNKVELNSYQSQFEDTVARKSKNFSLTNKDLKEQLEHIARYDYLTKIPNRFYLEEFINNIYTRIQKTEGTLLIIDLDNFKIINNSYGYSIGDKILVSVANCIKNKLREKDFIARLDGDKFAIFLPNTNISGAQVVANKILEALEEEPYCIIENNIQINVGASIGITAIGNEADIKQLFPYADAALHAAKNKGKNSIAVLEDERDKKLLAHNCKIFALIQEALIEDKFQIHLQPVYKVGNGLLHYEVLVRMLHGNNNLLLPSSFIPLAEQYGLMPLIDKWVIKNVIKLITKEKHLNVFINLSGSSICDDTLLQWIEFTLNHSSINPKRIGFEITETTAIKDLKKAKMWVDKLKALGCKFALDDFGVGFSSFSYLDILPVDYIKIDGTFVRNLDSDPKKLALVKAINMVAHTLGKKTIAEFVENESAWKVLQELGVDCGQGYYLGKPVPFEHIKSIV